ncbi:hypothetical protein K7G98_42285, partial [Saccharothrix sp. MB29]|nr:hypothetical protein [Saccharothrix sp. MB29]
MIRELLFRDLDGTYLTEPRTVIEAAFDEPRYLERVPALRAVVTDDSARPAPPPPGGGGGAGGGGPPRE